MRCAGIVAEYNPFHNGHKYHIQSARCLTGCDKVIAIMSGGFVQRGEPAIFDKFTRARAALECGADMVIELPTVFALSSAEQFARGAVRILNSSQIVDYLCFGSECGELSALTSFVAASDTNSEELGNSIRAMASDGKSYSRSFYEASLKSPASAFAADVLKTPNSLLAAEYIRSLKATSSHILPYCIKRKGAQYGETDMCGEYSSAAAIRNALSNSIGALNVLNAIPSEIRDRFVSACDSCNFSERERIFFKLLQYRVLTSDISYLSSIAHVTEGLENVMFRAAKTCAGYDEFLFACKSKRYTMARIRRIASCAVLGINSELMRSAYTDDSALYIRVLGVRKDSLDCLRELSNNSSVPIITRYSDIKALSPLASSLIDLDILSSDIQSLVTKRDSKPLCEYNRPFLCV